MRLRVLGPDPALFPDPSTALMEPNGLLAVGGDLSVARLQHAYRQGIFPWFGEDEPPLWWSPNPRAVFDLSTLSRHTSLRRQIRQHGYRISIDAAFGDVIQRCAKPRPESPGQWLTPEMIQAYYQLHCTGDAHSVEVWDQAGNLIGGLYGVACGAMFGGESMFSAVSNGSKIALFSVCRLLHSCGSPLLDCQVLNAHTERLGAINLPRAAFLDALARQSTRALPWAQWRQMDLTGALWS